MHPPSFDPHVLEAIRDTHSKDPTIFEVGPLNIHGVLVDEGYFESCPSLAEVGATVACLEVEREEVFV
jgi:hypothetical protein